MRGCLYSIFWRRRRSRGWNRTLLRLCEWQHNQVRHTLFRITEKKSISQLYPIFSYNVFTFSIRSLYCTRQADYANTFSFHRSTSYRSLWNRCATSVSCIVNQLLLYFTIIAQADLRNCFVDTLCIHDLISFPILSYSLCLNNLISKKSAFVKIAQNLAITKITRYFDIRTFAR